ncbi:MAG: hypothetical protein IT342_01055 [Candidatus Melainabacteria bacterium]|nr:hypothetical protein [Candidatus Melainabacteria bacterium]
MPSVTSLIRPFFHPGLPLVGLNYTEVAHVTLHAFALGWTPAIRLCRGIVFNRRGTLVAFPLYGLVPEAERRQYHKTVCQKFCKQLETEGKLKVFMEIVVPAKAAETPAAAEA